MKVAFEVLQSTPSNEGKTFVWKLQVIELVEAFGVKKSVKRTYYIGGMPVEGVVGTKIVEDINKFEIIERPFDNPESGETMLLKWLHVKVALDRKAA